jgi:hypothetical protein
LVIKTLDPDSLEMLDLDQDSTEQDPQNWSQDSKELLLPRLAI